MTQQGLSKPHEGQLPRPVPSEGSRSKEYGSSQSCASAPALNGDNKEAYATSTPHSRVTTEVSVRYVLRSAPSVQREAPATGTVRGVADDDRPVCAPSEAAKEPTAVSTKNP